MNDILEDRAPSNSPQFYSASSRLVSQVDLLIAASSEGDPFEVVRWKILRYIEKRANSVLPPEAWDGEDFVLDGITERRVEVVTLHNSRTWALRFEDEDRDIAGRFWVVDTVISGRDVDDEASDLSVSLTTQVRCVTRTGRKVDTSPFFRSVPTFLRAIGEACDCRVDGRKVEPFADQIITLKDSQRLIDLLRDPDRRADVVVLTCPPGSEDVSDCLLPPDRIAERLIGVAHVVAVAGPATFDLTEALGKEFSVFHQGVRTYRPGLDIEQDDPFAHPLTLPQRARGWSDGVRGYGNFLVDRTIEQALGRLTSRRMGYRFSDVKAAISAQRRKTAEASAGAEEQLASLRAEYEEAKRAHREEINETQEILRIYEDERDEAVATVARLEEQVADLKHRLTVAIHGSIPTTRVEDVPNDFSPLTEWIERNLDSSVAVLPRALKAAKGSKFEDPALAYRALILLRDAYVPMKRGEGQRYNEAWTIGLGELGLEDSMSITRNRAGEQGDTYLPRVGDKRVFLDRHLKKGTNRDERICFRLYFTWDAESERVIVGSFPGHLTNRMT